MANQEIENDYEEVFDLVYPQLGNSSNGILYKVIHLLLETEESLADKICNRYHIKDNASLDDDEAIFAHFIEKPNLLPSNDNWLKQKMRDFIINNLNRPEIAKIVWIVIIACILVGVPSCIQYLNRKQKQRGNARNLQPDFSVSQSLPPITAALCLVVPASVIFDLRNTHQNAWENNSLSCSDVKMLIDNSSHFLCTKIEDVHSIEQDLKVTEQEITNDSNQEVYVRIHITNGRDIIGKEVPYTLKRDLPPDGQRIVERYKCLKNLSGLEKFHHI